MEKGLPEKLFALYTACFPGNIRAEKTVRDILARPDNICLAQAQGERLLAAALISGNTVLMLCVLPAYRRQGIGGQLLDESEALVRGRGIATRMVRLGTKYLQSLGLSQAFLGYTYTDIIPMYERSGYRVCQKYLMAKKSLAPAVDIPAR